MQIQIKSMLKLNQHALKGTINPFNSNLDFV